MLARLRAELGGKGWDVDRFAGALLRACRDSAATVRAAYSDQGAWEYLPVGRRCAARWLHEEVDDLELTAAQTDAALALLESLSLDARAATAPDLADAIAVRALAEAVDEVWGHRMLNLSRRQGRTELRTGDPFPVVNPPLKAVFKKTLGTEPGRRGPQIDALRSLRILRPTTLGHQVVIDARHADVLATFGHDALLAIGVPCCIDDLDFDRHEEGGQRYFRNVRPRDPETIQHVARRIVAEAALAKAVVLLLPELSLSAAHVEDLVHRVATEPTMVLAVLGSVHRLENDRLRNISTALLGGAVIEHHKFNPFILPLPVEGLETRTDHIEGIDTSPATITVHVAGDWSFTILICKDFLEEEVDGILEDLRVRLTLVPACSEKTDAFETRAQAVAQAAQGVVAIANQGRSAPITPPSQGAPEDPIEPLVALLARPVRPPAPAIVRGAPIPSLHVTRLGAVEGFQSKLVHR